MDYRGRKNEEYKIYCHMVEDDNRLSYNWWRTALVNWGRCYKDMHSYVMQKNKPLAKEFLEYKSRCTDCESFNLQWFRLYFSKRWWTMEDILILTKKNPYIYRWHMTSKKPKNKISKSKIIEREKKLAKKLRLKRIEQWHPVN